MSSNCQDDLYKNVDSDPSVKTKIIKDFSIGHLPEDVTISTMTLICKLATKFNCENIAKYIDLDMSRILTVTHGELGNTKTNRTIVQKKKTSGKPKKQKKVFYNQVSMYVKVHAKNKKPVNIKLFSNGSIHMTGCKTVENAIETLIKVLYELKKEKAVIDYAHMKVVDKPFCDNLEILDLKNIIGLQIVMINSGFHIPFKMDRNKLYNLLLSDGYECLYDAVKHACVNVKYSCEEKIISIFVFEKGSILITGARNCTQIQEAYMFINKYLLKNHKHIKKNEALSNSNIAKYLGSYKIKNINPNDNDFFK